MINITYDQISNSKLFDIFFVKEISVEKSTNEKDTNNSYISKNWQNYWSVK
jgi:hypothetical protein